MSKKRLYIVRHGQAEGSVQGFSQTKPILLTEAEQKQQLSTSMQINNTGITLLEYKNGDCKLITFNDLAHFAE